MKLIFAHGIPVYKFRTQTTEQEPGILRKGSLNFYLDAWQQQSPSHYFS